MSCMIVTQEASVQGTLVNEKQTFEQIEREGKYIQRSLRHSGGDVVGGDILLLRRRYTHRKQCEQYVHAWLISL